MNEETERAIAQLAERTIAGEWRASTEITTRWVLQRRGLGAWLIADSTEFGEEHARELKERRIERGVDPATLRIVKTTVTETTEVIE